MALGIVRNDSFLFHKAHQLRFPITFRTHLVIIRSLFIYLRLFFKNFVEIFMKIIYNFPVLRHT